MERLTKTYSDGTHGAADNLPCGENSYTYKGLLLEVLGKYEDDEEQGLLLRFPCKVGGTMYRAIPKLFRSYVKIVINEINITKNGIYITSDKGVSWNVNEIGKTIFFTQEEAEQKLKEMESK